MLNSGSIPGLLGSQTATGSNIGAGQATPAQWKQQAQQWIYQTPTEPKWPNQMCELLAEAGRLLLEENNRLKARVAELETAAHAGEK